MTIILYKNNVPFKSFKKFFAGYGAGLIYDWTDTYFVNATKKVVDFGFKQIRIYF